MSLRRTAALGRVVPVALACALSVGFVSVMAPGRANGAGVKAGVKSGAKAGVKSTAGRTGNKVRRTNGRKAAPKARRVLLERRVPALKGNFPNVQALGSLVVDLDSGEELFARKPDQPRPIASVSKLLAALVVVEKGLELEGLTTIKKIDAEVARGGARSRLLEGMTLSNRDLLHAALMGSDNRAVAALGRAVGLGASQLAAGMTQKAAELGLKNTRFREPTGLSPENVSTPREAVAMLRAAMDHPLLGTVIRRLEYDAHPVARPVVRYVNTHKPAHRANTQVLGGKTGYNDAARYCLVLVARVDGRLIGMSVLGTEGELTRFGDVARVADWIVSRKPKAPLKPSQPQQAVAKAPAPGATSPASNAGAHASAGTPVAITEPGPQLSPPPPAAATVTAVPSAAITNVATPAGSPNGTSGAASPPGTGESAGGTGSGAPPSGAGSL